MGHKNNPANVALFLLFYCSCRSPTHNSMKRRHSLSAQTQRYISKRRADGVYSFVVNFNDNTVTLIVKGSEVTLNNYTLKLSLFYSNVGAEGSNVCEVFEGFRWSRSEGYELYCMVWENGILLISLHVSISRCKCNKSTADTIVVSLVQVKK